MARKTVQMFRLLQLPGPVARGQLTVNTNLKSLKFGAVGLAQNRWSSSKPDSAAEIVQNYQGGEHEFSSSRARDTVSEELDSGMFPNQVDADHPPQNGSGTQPRKQFAGKDEHVEKYDSQGTVSLHSVMQSTVPEPFQPTGKTGSNPTHLNMPGGGVKLKDKYLSDKRVKDAYTSIESIPKRKYGTSVSYLAAKIDFESDIPCPQGVQGYEHDADCSNFKLWMENCRRYGFSSCVEQLEGIQSGRKTLHQVFAEQEELIRQIAQSYYSARPDDGASMQGVQGSGTATVQAPDAQGLQVFSEQEHLIRDVAMKYKEAAQSKAGSNPRSF